MVFKSIIRISLSASLFFLSVDLINAQSFFDQPIGEQTGDFPSKWEKIEGDAHIGLLDGTQVILLDNEAIIAPQIGDEAYLGNSFTIAFDAFFDEVSKIPLHQVYNVRLWTGNDRIILDNGGAVEPMKIYCTGVKFKGSVKSKFDYAGYDRSMGNPQNEWRHVVITYDNGSLTVKSDEFLAIDIPDLPFVPTAVSFGAYTHSYADFKRAIKNIRVEGIEETLNDESDTTRTVVSNGDEPCNYKYILPVEDGRPRQILQTNGKGIVSWVDDKPDIDMGKGNNQMDLDYAFPKSDGEFDQVLKTDGKGTVRWVDDKPDIDPDTVSGQMDLDYKLPKADGLADQVLQTDGKGTVRWVDPEFGDEKSRPGNTNSKNSEEEYSGLVKIDEGDGPGWRLKGFDPKGYGNIGEGAVDLSYSTGPSSSYGATGAYSLAMGSASMASGEHAIAIGMESSAKGKWALAIGPRTSASGYGSVAIGLHALSSGEHSRALGWDSKSRGYCSTSMGYATIADGFSSTAMGQETYASGDYSTAMGVKTRAMGEGSLAAGEYNKGWPHALLEVGNGSVTARSNILTVYHDRIDITKGRDLNLNGGGYLVIGDLDKANLVFDNNEILARNNKGVSTLYLQHNGGDLSVGGKVVHNSDRRLKKDIEDLDYGLSEVKKLSPKSYLWKKQDDQSSRSIGLIAQEVQPVIDELVTEDEKGTLAVDYTGLIPVLINAVKEQQEMIESLKKRIEQLENNQNNLYSEK